MDRRQKLQLFLDTLCHTPQFAEDPEVATFLCLSSMTASSSPPPRPSSRCISARPQESASPQPQQPQLQPSPLAAATTDECSDGDGDELERLAGDAFVLPSRESTNVPQTIVNANTGEECQLQLLLEEASDVLSQAQELRVQWYRDPQGFCAAAAAVGRLRLVASDLRSCAEGLARLLVASTAASSNGRHKSKSSRNTKSNS
eukprot:TRINITY_DN2847_c0_g2_i12.p2 TRINITY_DN2847_c0_g2~~TRINITY_DN2847_c0_g2_i12.p2  ORF type:complete len:202 (+),score=64.74 TRINITY_DN2847_c0_g2_i12:831-1436(+)